MAEIVEVIQARAGGNRQRNAAGQGYKIERKRVAAYVRVSTDGEEQLHSFHSQKEYYTEKISQNDEWAMVGIYADEAITGTKTTKREGFLNLINDCLNGLIDVVLTKSISRFSRNLVDTLQYVRLLKEKGVAIVFEKENINTLSMESEMALALLSTLAQNEVESLSANVKLGVKMKMKRGELMGFNGCLGYDYHKEDKSITVNEEEAEIVRYIFERYLQGYGAYSIMKDLVRLQKKNKNGIVSWSDSGVRGIIKNEKYKGDLLLGKTFTVDPISKRRLANMGEEEQYYIKDHHQAIVTEEIWEEAKRIRESRWGESNLIVDENRKIQARKFAFSSMCECGFCATNLTRRSHFQDRQNKKPVWKCRTSTNKGVANCPNSKTIDEVILESAFVETFNLLAKNFDDVMESVIQSIEETLSSDEGVIKLKRVDSTLSSLKSKRAKLTDLFLEDKISKEVYDEKLLDFNRKISITEEEKRVSVANVSRQKNISQRMKDIRKKINEVKTLKKFDRVVFESIVQKVIIGEQYPDGTTDPYNITFVLNGIDNASIQDAKGRYMQFNKKKIS